MNQYTDERNRSQTGSQSNGDDLENKEREGKKKVCHLNKAD